MNKLLWPVLLTLTLTACSTTSTTPAAVEDRTGADATAGTGTASGAQTTPDSGAAVTGSAMEGSATDAATQAAMQATKSFFFDYDSFVVKDEYRSALETHAALLLAKREVKIILQGNTDERGSREYNLALGQKRAEAVRKALLALGVTEAQMEAVSFGEEKPRNEADDEAAFAENRRTDLVYSGAQ
jgi:peptidoglycan-associated lipoprotein